MTSDTLEQAQQRLTAFATRQDGRRPEGRDGSTTGAVMFAAERLKPLPPTLFPVVVTEERTATRQALNSATAAKTLTTSSPDTVEVSIAAPSRVMT